MKISIVCASHKGRYKLPKLINSIYTNTIKIHEIVLCVTDKKDIILIPDKLISKLNIKIIISPISNQSKQRKMAIKKSSGDYIIQFDDDLILQNDVLEKFKDHFDNSIENKIVSAVVLLPDNSYQSARWNMIYNSSKIFRFIIFLLNGFNRVHPMSIIKSGRIIPLLRFDQEKNLINNAEWLNSCIMYNRKVIEHAEIKSFSLNKSYYEDVFFSHSLFINKYKLIVDNNIRVNHHYVDPTNILVFIKTIYVQYKIVRRFNKSIILFILDVFIFFVLYLISTITNNFRKN